MRYIVVAGLIAASLSSAASSRDAESNAGQTFVEIGGGASAVHADSFEFTNPNGANYIANFPFPVPGVSKTDGDDILLDSQRRNAFSPAAELTVGYFLSHPLYVRATYRYLGRYHLSGSAGFPLDPTVPVTIAFDQDYYLRGHGAYLGIGLQKDLTNALFLDVSAEAGAARLRSVSRQGANVGDPFGHPARSVTNLSGGLEAGLGVHVGRKIDLIFKGHADLLGIAETGLSEQMISADGNYGINPDEQLKLHNLTNYGAAITLRASF